MLWQKKGYEIWFDSAKSGIIGKILMSRVHEKTFKNFLTYFFIFLIIILKKLSGFGKNYVYCKCE
jgi:hypothetical protein